MNSDDPNVAKVELVAQALGELREQLVFVGGCAVGLLLTDPAAAPPRVTYDVDLVAEVAALRGYHQLEREFSKRGFERDMAADAPICRWRYQRLEIDLMPTDPGVLGFANRWYPLAVAGAERVLLPSGTSIRLIGAAAFMATKFEAFADRGRDDLLGSHDAEDIVNLVDGRAELSAEVGRAPADLRAYLRERCSALLARPDFADALPGMIFPDDALAERVTTVTQRLNSIASSS
ncbi:MAG: nucleotidyl transferase AbiEii/AbiGii toxin family protein [Caldimonas sp.]